MDESARAPGRKRRTWTYEQTLPGESPDVALERAVEKFETYVGRLLREFDRPVRIHGEIHVVELPALDGDAGVEHED